DPSVAGNRAIEQLDESAALRARAKRRQVVARRIAGKGRSIVELTDDLGSRVVGQPKVRNAAGCAELRLAGVAPPVERQRPAARGTAEQIAHAFRRSRK